MENLDNAFGETKLSREKAVKQKHGIIYKKVLIITKLSVVYLLIELKVE